MFNQWNFKYDFAIWKLKLISGDLGLVNTSIKYDDASRTKTGTMLTVLGWGVTANGQQSKTLQQVVVPVVNDLDCQEAYASQDYDATSFCAGFEKGGKDSCQADSGGPAFTVENGTSYLVGLVSYGKGCAQAGYPGVYSRIHMGADWINLMI